MTSTKLTALSIFNQHAIFFFIIVIASFLRFHRLSDQMTFFGDQGRDFIAARDMVRSGNIPLLGIPSSRPQFRQGPIFIWLLAPALMLSNFNPVGGAYLAAAIGLLTVALLYLVTKNWFGAKAATISSLVLATSPMAVVHSRLAFHINPIPFASLLYLVALNRFINHRASFFWPAAAFGFLFQFELATFPLILLLPLALLLKRKKLKPKQIITGMLGLTFSLLPQIVHDLTHQFDQLGAFLFWAVRFLGSFFSFRKEFSNATTHFSNTINIFLEYAQRFFSFNLIWPTIIILVFISAHIVYRLFHRPQNQELILFTWVGLLLAGFIINSNPSEAYFPALFIPMAILFARAVSSLPKYFLPLFISVAVLNIVNTKLLLTSNFLTSIPIISQKQLVSTLLQETNGPLNLQTTDSGGEFSSYLDNYRYLIESQGGQLDSQTGTKIWIQTTPDSPSIPNTKVIKFNGQTLAIPHD